MPRRPDINPEDVRQVMSASPRPTSTEAARVLARRLGKPVSAGYIRQVVRRHPDWELEPALENGSLPALDYECERALGPIEREHKATNAWTCLTTYERFRAGLLGETEATKAAETYVARKLRAGLVVDYHRDTGLYDRIALPWEEGCYLKQPLPEFPRLEVDAALSGEPPGERREFWIRWRESGRTDAVLTRRNA